MDPNQQPTQNPNPNPWPNQTPAPDQTPDPLSPSQPTPDEQPQFDVAPSPEVSFQPTQPEQPIQQLQPVAPIIQPERPLQQLQPESPVVQPEQQPDPVLQPEMQSPQTSSFEPQVEPQAFGQPVAPEQLNTQPQPALVANPMNSTQGLSAAQTVPEADNPGKTLGIISIVVSLFGLGLVGLILGVISRKKSKAANAPATLGTIGTVLGAISTAAFVILVAIVAISFNAISSRADEVRVRNSTADLSSQVESVTQKAEIYNAKEGDYPKNLSEFENHPETTLPDDLYVNSAIYTNTSPTYVYCEEGAAQIVHLGDSKDDKVITALGAASVTEECARSL